MGLLFGVRDDPEYRVGLFWVRDDPEYRVGLLLGVWDAPEYRVGLLLGVRDDPEYQVSRITITQSKDFEEMDVASYFFGKDTFDSLFWRKDHCND